MFTRKGYCAPERPEGKRVPSLLARIPVYFFVSFVIGPLICVAMIAVSVIMIPIMFITGAEFPKFERWMATWLAFVERLSG